MKTFALVVEVVRTDNDEPVITLVRTPQGNVLDTCPMESLGSSISKIIDSSQNGKK